MDRGDLIVNIDKLHTTELGIIRICKNLKLSTNNVVNWCKEATLKADRIVRQGKNWYVYYKGMAITINAFSYTIITAHKLNPTFRIMQQADYECLNEFLFQSIFIPEGEQIPPRSIINLPEIFVYIKDFGNKPSDLGVVAEQNGLIIGAAWSRIIPAYGNVADDTPELAISLLPEFRGYGIGTKLLKNLFELLREKQYKQISLSVQKNNPAVHLYKRLGFKIYDERPDNAGHEDYLMIKDLK